jgi:hypothetical protein
VQRSLTLRILTKFNLTIGFRASGGIEERGAGELLSEGSQENWRSDAQLKADLGKVIRIATKLAAFNSGSVKG